MERIESREDGRGGGKQSWRGEALDDSAKGGSEHG